MKFVILEDYELACDFAAKYLCKRIKEFGPGPDRLFTLGLPTGSSPLGIYKNLIKLHAQGHLSFEFVRTFNMDEYCGLSRDHPQSYHHFMYQNFFRHIDIDPKNVNILDGTAADLSAECERFEAEISRAGGIDLFLAGIGADGHIAFNEPGTSLQSRTHVQALNIETISANARFFSGRLDDVPKEAVTVGVGTIMDAREILMIVNGVHKALAVHKSVESGISSQWTASALQMHPQVIWVVEECAALELKVRFYKHFKAQLSNYMQLI